MEINVLESSVLSALQMSANKAISGVLPVSNRQSIFVGKAYINAALSDHYYHAGAFSICQISLLLVILYKLTVYNRL